MRLWDLNAGRLLKTFDGHKDYVRSVAISTDGKRTHTYEAGDVAYWSPGPDVAIYYRQDNEKIPPPGIIVIGKIDSGVEALNVPGSVRVTFERLQ